MNDGGGICGVSHEQATPLLRLTGPDEWITDSTGQADMGQAGRGGKNLAPPNGKVCFAGDGVQSKEGMRYGAASGQG